MNMRDNLLATAAMRAEYMEEAGFITLPDGAGREDEVAQFCADLADEYIADKPDTPFDLFIEERLTEEYGEKKYTPAPATAPAMHEAERRKRVTITVTGRLVDPSDLGDLNLRERLTWEAQFGENGKYYVFDADAGEAFLVIPKGVNTVGAEATFDNAWLWYDAASLVDFLNYTWGEALTPDFFRSIFQIPELLTDKVYQALMDSIKEAK